RVRETPQQLISPVVLHDRFGDDASERRHPRGEPGGHAPAVQRQVRISAARRHAWQSDRTPEPVKPTQSAADRDLSESAVPPPTQPRPEKIRREQIGKISRVRSAYIFKRHRRHRQACRGILMRWSAACRIAALIAFAAGTAVCRADAESDGSATTNPAPALSEVLIIANAPLPGFGLPLAQIPANVQTATSLDLQNAQVNNVADYLSRRFMGVNISDSADNPFQLDINYHGFTASPLVGTPEGLSVYVDGVRVNESFGDTVNWDLVSESAISSVSLISGSNPVFGLNTLGGALSLQTKSGHDNPGTQFEAYGGSFGRRAFEAETGGERGAFDYFATVNYFDETGWRDMSSSRLWQAFGKVGWQTEKTDLDLSYTYADTSLFGNGALPQSMLAYRRAQSYTPDFTHNLLHFINLTGSQFLSEHLLLTGNAYYRRLMTGSSNVSNNDNYLSENYPGPPVDCDATPSDRAALAYCAQAATQLSGLRQRTAGLGLQLTDAADLFGHKNQGILGVDYSD